MGAIDNLLGQVTLSDRDSFGSNEMSRVGCEIVPLGHPDRQEIECFIAEVFAHRYGAKINWFNEMLMGCRDAAGKWIAAAGFSPLGPRKAFLESYLDHPAETLIARDRAQRGNEIMVPREGIVEVGNLAAIRPGGARTLIIEMTRQLHCAHFEWVVITATREIANSLARLGYAPCVLAEADPGRLPDKGRRWGSYYDCRPKVMYVDVAASYARIAHAPT